MLVKSTNVEFVGICETNARVPVVVGRVNVPVFVIVEMIGLVNVLLVSVCALVSVTNPARSLVSARVPVVVGNVSVPVFVIVLITGAPENVLIPEIVCADVRST
jgi:hypothetical protein